MSASRYRLANLALLLVSLLTSLIVGEIAVLVLPQ